MEAQHVSTQLNNIIQVHHLLDQLHLHQSIHHIIRTIQYRVVPAELYNLYV